MAGSNKILIKRIIFIMILVLLCLPGFQQLSDFFNVKPLKGAVKKVDKPVLSVGGWMSGDYQLGEEEFINHNFGFRASFVRLHNQIDFWLFDKINANNVLMGKDGYLYEYSYIREYLGLNFLGKDVIDKKVDKLKSVSDSLSKRGIDLVVLLAAGKASYFPEYFPDSLSPESKTISNYDYFSKAFNTAGILNIDINKWFVSMKDTSKYSLFTKGGIHWSKYGEYLVADSLISYVEKLKGVKLPHFKLESIEVTTEPRFRDNDIGEGMNLMVQNSDLKKAYPVLSFDSSGVVSSVKAMVVADSYYWELYNMGLSRNVFNHGQFWYYNKKIYSSQPGWVTLPVDEANIRKEVEKNDVVFILQTEATLYRFAFGFIDKQFELYQQTDYDPYSEPEADQEIASVIRKIKASDNWYSKVREKAKVKGITIDKMLLLEARYVVDNRHK